MKRKTTEEYLQQLIDLDIPYTLIGEYITNNTPILHECVNNHRWEVSPSNILMGRGCPECSGKKKKTLESYQKELDNRPGGYVALGPYINNKTKIKHKCPKGHEWYVTPKDLVGQKQTTCPYCVKRYIDYDAPALLYYIRIVKEGEIFYKIGITKNSLAERYKGSDLNHITPLLERWYDKGWKAAEQEKLILKEFKEFICKDPNLLKRGGEGTEIFNKDVLQLEKSN